MTNVSEIYQSELEPDRFYHVFNRANGNDKLFFQEGHYSYFMDKYKEYLTEYLDTFAYCLLPNHFHLLVRIKSKQSVLEAAGHDLLDLKNLADQPGKLISEKFKRFFISYAKSINKQRGRKGSLFMKPFKRIPIDSIEYLRNAIVYIHRNPIEHGMVRLISDHKWTSYHEILNPEFSFRFNEEYAAWFGDRENFAYCHQQDARDDRRNEEFEEYFLA